MVVFYVFLSWRLWQLLLSLEKNDNQRYCELVKQVGVTPPSTGC